MIPPLDGNYIFGTWTQHHGKPAGAIFVSDRQESDSGMWNFEELKLNQEKGLGHFLLAFGQNNEGEVFVLTSDEPGPVGNTGKVYQLVKGE